MYPECRNPGGADCAVLVIPSRQMPCWPGCIQVDNAARCSGDLSSPNVLCRLPCSKMSVVCRSPPRENGLFPRHSSPLKEAKDLGHTSDQRHDVSDGPVPQPCKSVPVTELTQNNSPDSNSSAVTENVRFLREWLARADITQDKYQHSALGDTESLPTTVCSS